MARRRRVAQPPIPQPDTASDERAPGRVLGGVVACFVLSGFAALLYQTAWLRQFSLVFGTSELAVAAVLAAYMGGLAAGAAVAGRWMARVERPVRVYGILEGGIALFALAVPVLLAAASAGYVTLLGGQASPPNAATLGQPLFYLAVAFVVLALPTGFMGATLPLLTRHAVQSNRELGPRVALLYATNTAGAVAGTVTAAFVLLPALGLNGTVWVGVAVNAAVFGIAVWLSRKAPPIAVAAESAGNASRIALPLWTWNGWPKKPDWHRHWSDAGLLNCQRSSSTRSMMSNSHTPSRNAWRSWFVNARKRSSADSPDEVRFVGSTLGFIVPASKNAARTNQRITRVKMRGLEKGGVA